MNGKKIWILIVGIVIIIGAALVYVLANKNDMPYQQDTNQTDTTQNTNQNNAPSNSEPTNGGRYVEYSAEEVANTQGRKWLFFHAGWCPQCRALENDINSSGVPSGLTIFKVDYDTADELKQKYGVTLQTTIVEIDDEGNEIKKFVAYDDPTLNAVLSALGR